MQILTPKDNEKQNIEDSYRSKYRKHVACSCGYKLEYVDVLMITLVKLLSLT